MPGLIVSAPAVLADGTDILEPTSAMLEDGSRIIGAGVGLSLAQPGQLEIEVPDDATVEQVLLYWDGADRDYAGAAPVIGVTEDTVQVDGMDVTGTFIGGRTFVPNVQLFTFRADITAKQLVNSGSNTLEIGGLDFGTTSIETGAGVLVVIEDGSGSTLQIFDGSDYAYINCPAVEGANCLDTVKRTFTFAAAESARDAELVMFFTSVVGEVSTGGEMRPTLVEISVGGAPPIQYVNDLNSNDGDEWDTLTVEFEVPPGVSQVEVQAFSEDLEMTGALPASFKWLTAALSVPNEELHGGGQGCTPGYWRQDHHYPDWTSPYDPDDSFSDHFDDAFPGMTMGDVVDENGGLLNQLGSHAVAALLNAANPEVSYDKTTQEIIDQFNAVYPGTNPDYEALKDEFEALNELGCPLDNSDGSNDNSNNGNPNGNGGPDSNFTILDTNGSPGIAKQSSGGGAFGLFEILALLLVGLTARLRAGRSTRE